MIKITAKDVYEALTKHYAPKEWSKPTHKLFAEVVPGSVFQGTRLRLDAIAYKLSWAKPEIIGFEIKVKRNDFLQDDKWTGYLPFVNKMYFACPEGLIKPHELPDNIGLVFLTDEGKLKWSRRAKIINVLPDPILDKFLIINRLENNECPHHVGRYKAEHEEAKLQEAIAEDRLTNLVYGEYSDLINYKIDKCNEMNTKQYNEKNDLKRRETRIDNFKSEWKSFLKEHDIYFESFSDIFLNPKTLFEKLFSKNMIDKFIKNGDECLYIQKDSVNQMEHNISKLKELKGKMFETEIKEVLRGEDE